MSTEKERAKECNQGNSNWVCHECSTKYSERQPYSGTTTVHEGKCYICEKTKTVGPSRKSFGHHRFL